MQTLNEKDLSFIKENIQTNYEGVHGISRCHKCSHRCSKERGM